MKLLAGLVVAIAGAALWLGPLRWNEVKARIRREFPQVRQISTAQLADWLADKDRTKPVLLDVRAAEEFDVSHLTGARRIDPAAQTAPGVNKDAPIVTYCSVGYRSSSLATRLIAAGYTNVQNLEGSIFQWANEGRPLVRDGKPADKVHPYDKRWGELLRPERRARK